MDGSFAPVAGSATTQPCVDLEHLRRYTMGNRALEIEILQLFTGQAPDILAQLAAAGDAKAWHMAAHTLKGSARAVGADRVARLAEAAETAGHASDARADLLAGLGVAIAEATAFTASLQRAA